MNVHLKPFTKNIVEITKNAKLLNDQQLADVDRTQAIFDVAHDKNVGLVPPSMQAGDILHHHYNTPAKVATIIEKYNLDQIAIDAKIKGFKSGSWPQNAPYFMDILETYNHISPIEKDILLTAQYAAKTALAVESLERGIAAPLAQSLSTQRYPLKNESDLVKATQSSANCAALLASAVQEFPYLKQQPSIQSAFTALELLSAQGFKQGAASARDVGMTSFAAQMEAAREGQKSDINEFSALASTSALVAKLEDGFAKAAQHIAQTDTKLSASLSTAFQKQKDDIKKLSVFGSRIAPDMFFTKKDLSFVQRIAQSRDLPNEHQR